MTISLQWTQCNKWGHRHLDLWAGGELGRAYNCECVTDDMGHSWRCRWPVFSRNFHDFLKLITSVCWLKIHQNMFLCINFTIDPQSLRETVAAEQRTMHYLIQWQPSSMTPSVGLSQSLHWRHNEGDDISNHRRLYCLLNRLLIRRRTKLRVIGLCQGNPSMTSGFPSQRASNAENVFIWWRHNVAVDV